MAPHCDINEAWQVLPERLRNRRGRTRRPGTPGAITQQVPQSERGRALHIWPRRAFTHGLTECFHSANTSERSLARGSFDDAITDSSSCLNRDLRIHANASASSRNASNHIAVACPGYRACKPTMQLYRVNRTASGHLGFFACASAKPVRQFCQHGEKAFATRVRVLERWAEPPHPSLRWLRWGSAGSVSKDVRKW